MRDNLRRVVDYAANPEKTEYGALSQALHYAGNDAKTTLPESAKLVSGIHCRPETAWADMRAVQRKFGKTEGVVAMHAYQSFQPGEVTPEQCHAIGVELARQVWGGRFQVLVATHMNTHCLHNHFVINAVSYVDGKKYEQRRSQYRELRRASDALCRAQGLSVVQTPGKSTPRPLYEAERRGEPTRYNRMREALRSALQQTSTEEDFALALRRMGYLWRREEGRKYATLRSVDGGRPVRVHRLGPEFDWPTLARVLDAHYYQFGLHYYSLFGGYDRPRRPPCRSWAKVRYKGLLDELFGKPHLGRQYLYFRYKVQAKPNPRASINWPEIEAIWRNVERTLEEMHLCFDRDFHTTDEVEAHRRELAAQIDALCKERADCARLLRHKVPPPGTAEHRTELTRQIKKLRHEDEVCDRILRRVRATTACRKALAEQARQRAEEKTRHRQRRRDRER